MRDKGVSITLSLSLGPIPETFVPRRVMSYFFPRFDAGSTLSCPLSPNHTRVQLLEVKWEDFLRAEALKEAVNNWKLAFPGEASVVNLSHAIV